MANEITEQKKLIGQMKEEKEKQKKQQIERMKVLERAKMLCERVSMKSEQCAMDVEKIETESSLFIDNFNQ